MEARLTLRLSRIDSHLVVTLATMLTIAMAITTLTSREQALRGELTLFVFSSTLRHTI